jgi:cell division inhibitor SepF
MYLGLVEDDDARGYGRYDSRQHDYSDREHDRRYYAGDDHYADGYAEDSYSAAEYPAGGYADDGAEPEEVAPARGPEPLTARRTSSPARPLGIAPTPSAGGSRPSGLGGGAAGAAGLAMREPAEAPVPEPAPAPVPQYRITTVTPRTYNEARLIGERYRDGCPVIMNLTELDDADAKRLVDFAAGLIFGLRGSIERVTAKVFLLSPQNVDVTAEDKARIREGGFFNQS